MIAENSNQQNRQRKWLPGQVLPVAKHEFSAYGYVKR